jgi:hypothetical protein
MTVCFVGNQFEFFFWLGKSYEVLDTYSDSDGKTYRYLIEDDLGYQEWQDIVDEEGLFRFLPLTGHCVKFNAKSFDNPSRSNIAVSGWSRQIQTGFLVSPIKVSDIRLENNQLVFNTFFTYLVYNKSYLTIDLSNIEGSSDNVYFISEDRKLISVERDEQFSINFTEVDKIREDKLNIILGCI